MEKAIEVLIGEHRLIEQVLGSLETYAGEVRAGAPLLREVTLDYAQFFREFADTCHHGKEEDILFQRLIERGMPKDAGPLAVMLYEHELGRAHVQGLADVGAAPDLGDRQVHLLLGHADAYVPLLRQHIIKEDRVLYPMALQMLTGPEMDAIDTEFEAFASRLHGSGSGDRLHGLAESLAARFRPDPVRLAAAAQASHCGVPAR